MTFTVDLADLVGLAAVVAVVVWLVRFLKKESKNRTREDAMAEAGTDALLGGPGPGDAGGEDDLLPPPVEDEEADADDLMPVQTARPMRPTGPAGTAGAMPVPSGRGVRGPTIPIATPLIAAPPIAAEVGAGSKAAAPVTEADELKWVEADVLAEILAKPGRRPGAPPPHHSIVREEAQRRVAAIARVKADAEAAAAKLKAEADAAAAKVAKATGTKGGDKGDDKGPKAVVGEQATAPVADQPATPPTAPQAEATETDAVPAAMLAVQPPADEPEPEVAAPAAAPAAQPTVPPAIDVQPDTTSAAPVATPDFPLDHDLSASHGRDLVMIGRGLGQQLVAVVRGQGAYPVLCRGGRLAVAGPKLLPAMAASHCRDLFLTQTGGRWIVHLLTYPHGELFCGSVGEELLPTGVINAGEVGVEESGGKDVLFVLHHREHTIHPFTDGSLGPALPGVINVGHLAVQGQRLYYTTRGKAGLWLVALGQAGAGAAPQTVRFPAWEPITMLAPFGERGLVACTSAYVWLQPDIVGSPDGSFYPVLEVPSDRKRPVATVFAGNTLVVLWQEGRYICHEDWQKPLARPVV